MKKKEKEPNKELLRKEQHKFKNKKEVGKGRKWF